MLWWIIGGIFLFLFCYAKFMEGYNSMDAPHQLRQQTKLQQQQLLKQQEQDERIRELEKELEIQKLRAELKELKENNPQP